MVKGATLSAESSSTDPNTVYHLDSGAVYRKGWEQTHVKITNDAVLHPPTTEFSDWTPLGLTFHHQAGRVVHEHLAGTAALHREPPRVQ